MLEYNVFIKNINSKTIVIYNVFTHKNFIKDCKRIYNDYYMNKKDFLEGIKNTLIYYFWRKNEWEITLSCFPKYSKFNDKKVDVYEQIMINWNTFSEYIWNNREELKS